LSKIRNFGGVETPNPPRYATDLEEKFNILGGNGVSNCEKNKVQISMYLILNRYLHTGHFEFTDLSRLDFCLWGWMKSEVYKRNTDTPDEPLARILDAAACRSTQDGTTRHLQTPVAKCTAVDAGILERLL
jgi:hypothetical protein